MSQLFQTNPFVSNPFDYFNFYADSKLHTRLDEFFSFFYSFIQLDAVTHLALFAAAIFPLEEEKAIKQLPL